MADENEGAQGSTGTSEGDQGGNTSGDTSGSASGAAGTSQEGTDDASKGNEAAPVTREEFDAVFKRMQAADQRASKAEQELNEKKRAEQDELTNTKQDLEKATARVGELEKLIERSALENAFLTYGKFTWHDPADALALLDREGVEVKDGKVTGLGPAIEKLAKAKSHLLKSETDGGNGNGSSGASGSANNGTRKGSQKANTTDYSSRFPALRKR